MIKHRGILTLICVLVLGCVSAAAGWAILGNRLPDPTQADRDGMLRWMVTRDLAHESPQVREALMARLVQELQTGVDVSAIDTAIGPESNQQFWGNVNLLFAEWFAARGREYAACDSQHGPEYVDRQIDGLLKWKTVTMLREKGGNSGSGDTQLFDVCQKRVQQWIKQAPPQDARNMQSLMDAVNANIAGRYLRQWIASPAAEQPSRR